MVFWKAQSAAMCCNRNHETSSWDASNRKRMAVAALRVMSANISRPLYPATAIDEVVISESNAVSSTTLRHWILCP